MSDFKPEYSLIFPIKRNFYNYSHFDLLQNFTIMFGVYFFPICELYFFIYGQNPIIEVMGHFFSLTFVIGEHTKHCSMSWSIGNRSDFHSERNYYTQYAHCQFSGFSFILLPVIFLVKNHATQIFL